MNRRDEYAELIRANIEAGAVGNVPVLLDQYVAPYVQMIREIKKECDNANERQALARIKYECDQGWLG